MWRCFIRNWIKYTILQHALLIVVQNFLLLIDFSFLNFLYMMSFPMFQQAMWPTAQLSLIYAKPKQPLSGIIFRRVQEEEHTYTFEHNKIGCFTPPTQYEEQTITKKPSPTSFNTEYIIFRIQYFPHTLPSSTYLLPLSLILAFLPLILLVTFSLTNQYSEDISQYSAKYVGYYIDCVGYYYITMGRKSVCDFKSLIPSVYISQSLS